MSVDQLRQRVAQTLRDHGIVETPEKGDLAGGLHSWRCAYPLPSEGPCTCFADLVTDLMNTISQEGRVLTSKTGSSLEEPC